MRRIKRLLAMLLSFALALAFLPSGVGAFDSSGLLGAFEPDVAVAEQETPAPPASLAPLVPKAAQSPPSAPTLQTLIGTTVILDTIPDAQYRMGTDGVWQDNSIFFLNSQAGGPYFFYARMRETGTSGASAPSTPFVLATAATGDATTSVTSVTSPAGANMNGNLIAAYVAQDVESQVVGLSVSGGATWRLYGDSSCTKELANRSMPLDKDTNIAYAKVTAQSGQATQVYSIVVTKASIQTGTGTFDSGGSTTVTGTGVTLITIPSQNATGTASADNATVPENPAEPEASAGSTDEISEGEAPLAGGADGASIAAHAGNGLSGTLFWIVLAMIAVAAIFIVATLSSYLIMQGRQRTLTTRPFKF